MPDILPRLLSSYTAPATEYGSMSMCKHPSLPGNEELKE